MFTLTAKQMSRLIGDGVQTVMTDQNVFLWTLDKMQHVILILPLSLLISYVYKLYIDDGQQPQTIVSYIGSPTSLVYGRAKGET
jgi:hypothetical protein